MKRFVCDVTREKDGEAYAGNVYEVTDANLDEAMVLAYIDKEGTHVHTLGDPEKLLKGLLSVVERLAHDCPNVRIRREGGFYGMGNE